MFLNRCLSFVHVFVLGIEGSLLAKKIGETISCTNHTNAALCVGGGAEKDENKENGGEVDRSSENQREFHGIFNRASENG